MVTINVKIENKQIPIKKFKEIFHFEVITPHLVIHWPHNAVLDSSTSWSIAAPNPTRLGQSWIHWTDRWFNQEDRRLFEQFWHVMSIKIIHTEWKAYLTWKKSGLFRSKSEQRWRNSNITIFLIQSHRIYEKSFFWYIHLFLWSSGFVLLACNQSLELGNSSNWSLMVSNFLIIQLALFQFQFRRQWKPLFSAEQSGTNSRGIFFFRQSILVKKTWMNLDTRVQ